MSTRILAEADRDRLRAALYGLRGSAVEKLFCGVGASAVARAAAGMPIKRETRRVILERLAEIERTPALRAVGGRPISAVAEP
jgi:hypothetical protein